MTGIGYGIAMMVTCSGGDGRRGGWLWGWMLLLGAALWGMGCSTVGPVDLLVDLEEVEPIDCDGEADCLDKGEAALNEGRFEVSRGARAEACRGGSVEGCRALADGEAMGAYGEPDEDLAMALYEWGCEEGDGASCHRRGELERRAGRYDESQKWFDRACEKGSLQGCHDGVLVELAGGALDDDGYAAARDSWGGLCDEGLDVACVNLGHMEAAGWGRGRDHNRAVRRFEQACQSPRVEQAATLSTPVGEVEPDLYAVGEYRPEVACEQWEMLAVGRVEERVASAMQAQREEMKACVEKLEEEVHGRLFFVADVGATGESLSPRIEYDEVEVDGIEACVEPMLSRYLDDRSGPGEFQARWGLSFLGAIPDSDRNETPADGGCDSEAIQQAVSQQVQALHRCGERHSARAGDDPGASLARVDLGSRGQVDEVVQRTTFGSRQLEECVAQTLQNIEVDEVAAGDGCAVELPLNFATRGRLHFSIVVRSASAR